MTTLQIDPLKAKALFPTASKEFKEMLLDTFGEKHFIVNITDRVKTFEDACELLELEPNDILAGSDSPDEQAYKKLKVIVKALNEGWKPDWEDYKQYKWYPWFKHRSGFGLVYDDCVYRGSSANVGSRLCFKSRELAEYAAKQFELLYRDYLTL